MALIILTSKSSQCVNTGNRRELLHVDETGKHAVTLSVKSSACPNVICGLGMKPSAGNSAIPVTNTRSRSSLSASEIYITESVNLMSIKIL